MLKTDLDRWKTGRVQFNSLAEEFSAVAETEADLNWKLREKLDSICASVQNVSEDFSYDAGMFDAD